MGNRGLGSTKSPQVLPWPSDRDEAAVLTRIILAQSDIAAATHDPGNLIEVVLERVQQLTGSEGAALELVDGEQLVYAAAHGVATSQLGLRFPTDTGLAALCVAEGRVLRCDDSEVDPRVNRAACREVGLRSMLVAPLRHAGRTIGVLKVMSPYRAAYRDVEVRTLERMSDLIGASIGHVLVRLPIPDAATPDPAGEAVEQGWEERIRLLVASGAISTVFQPVVRFGDRGVIGYEALSRFPPGTGSPDTWFGKATGLGLGTTLELEAARAALRHLPDIPEPLRLSINVSPETLLSPALDELLAPLDHSRLTLEITEHSTVDDYQAVCERVTDFRRRGIELAIDDAGAGFASLRHILHLVPDIIKLDVSLTRGIDQDTRRQALVSSILTFGTGTSTRVVVEGVETASELDALIALGVQFGQGYYLGRPGALPAR